MNCPMDKEYEHKYYESEKKNWWFVARRHAVLKLVSWYDKQVKILDVGCGGGSLINELISNGFQNVYGLDFSAEAVEVCKDRGIKNVYQMDGQNPGFDEEIFDIIIASDVIEHLENDVLALKNFYRILKKNGTLFVFVPAYKFLWTNFDEVNHHYRRYSRSELMKKLREANFYIDKTSFWNFTMFFPAFFMQIVKRVFKTESSALKQNMLLNSSASPVNKLLISLLKFENIFFKLLGLPIGMSLFVSAIKKK